jgi:hypothetical protein
MTQAISRDGFDELKNYLGVYLQQGRALLDSDWNENQDIAVSFLRRLCGESLGEGSPNIGFRIDPVFQNTIFGPREQVPDPLLAVVDLQFGPILYYLRFAGDELDTFESLTGFSLSSTLGTPTQGTLHMGRDRPAAGTTFLRLSGHPGTTRITKTLTNPVDLSKFDLATFKFRLNHPVSGDIRFFLEDVNADRSEWIYRNVVHASDLWLSGFAAPLDLSFQIFTNDLSPAVKDKEYGAGIRTFGGTTPLTWSVSSGSLPAGLILQADPDRAALGLGELRGTPTEDGTFKFTVAVTDVAGHVATRALKLDVRASGSVPGGLPESGMEAPSRLAKTAIPTGTPAKLAQIRRYGFELYQDLTQPLVWDLDELRVASSERKRVQGANNFVIRGSELHSLLNELTLLSALPEFLDFFATPVSVLQDVVDRLSSDFDLAARTIESAGRYYVDGLPCVQVEDVLYSEQRDPNDPPLSAPPSGTKRSDTVYLDVWTDAVTYVEDPAIREIALGGPDTSTRRGVRHRVRVAQGAEMPTGDGIGQGTLETEGTYTAQANRLYRVEIESPGDIGTATFRWSEDNASTLQRIIAPVPPGSQQIVVEDASAFHSGDTVLIRKEFGAERHRIGRPVGNVIALADLTGTGSELAALPAAAADPTFTTFSLADRPLLQRWNAFDVPITPDPVDATVSAAIALNDGVQVRFGGHGMRRGDCWTFAARYLAGDEASGFDPVARIERVGWRRARGVRHHYARLATLGRDGDSLEPDKILDVQDRRLHVANAGVTRRELLSAGVTGTTSTHLGSVVLPRAGIDSKFVIFWSGDLSLRGPVPLSGEPILTITVGFYSDEIIDASTDPDVGLIDDDSLSVSLHSRPVRQDIPLRLEFAGPPAELRAGASSGLVPTFVVPTSVHVFAMLNGAGFSIELSAMRLMALEIKKAY